MSSTFVEIAQKGFWISDNLLEIWLRLAALHIEASPEQALIAHGIRDQWLLASKGFFTGHVPVDLEAMVSSPQGEGIVRRAVESFMRALQAAPASLDCATLNLLGMEGGTFLGDLDTRHLIETSQAFLDLLDGKIATGAAQAGLIPSGSSEKQT